MIQVNGIWLTENQNKVLLFVNEYIDKHDFSPTITEVAKHMGFRYRSQAQIVIDRLCHYGFFIKKKESTRNLSKAKLIKKKKCKGYIWL